MLKSQVTGERYEMVKSSPLMFGYHEAQRLF